MTIPIDDLGDGFIEFNQFAKELRAIEVAQDAERRRGVQEIPLTVDAERELEILFGRKINH